MTVVELDQRILEVKLSGSLLVTQFTDILGISAGILDEKVIDDSDFKTDVDLHFKMVKQLQKDIKNINLSKNEKKYRAESVLTFEVKYLNDLEKLLKLAKDKKFDKDNRWKASFDNLLFCIENYQNNIATLEEYIQSL